MEVVTENATEQATKEVESSNTDTSTGTDNTENITNSETVESTFTKEQILKSKNYRHKRDLINALLVNGRSYTLKNVDEMIENFLKGAAK